MTWIGYAADRNPYGLGTFLLNSLLRFLPFGEFCENLTMTATYWSDFPSCFAEQYTEKDMIVNKQLHVRVMRKIIINKHSVLPTFWWNIGKKDVRSLRNLTEDCVAKEAHYVTNRCIRHHTPCLKKSQNCFRQNFIKFPPTLKTFGTKMAKRLKLYEVHSFSTSPNSCHHTTV